MMKTRTLTEKDDQDLVLFRDLHRRRRMPTLLQPDLSDDFEPNNPGNFSLYRMASGRKGPGYEFFAENDKNDYDWLKTPPATPLFPSLEMEANAPDLLIFQREIPIVQPLSRFGSDSPTARSSIGRPKSPKPKAKAVPLASRSVAPSHTTQRTPNTISLNNRKANVKDTLDFLTSNLTKNNTNTGAGTKPRSSSSSRGVSPSPTRPTILPAGFSNETPPNLRTDISRSTSATRGRPVVPSSSSKDPPTSSNINRTGDINRSTSATRGRAGATNNITAVSRKQSCSPSVTRGRKQQDHEILPPDAQKGKTRNNSNSIGTQFVGSRMVDKLMNARSKSGNEDRDSSTRPDSRGGSAKTTMMSRTSLNVTSKPNMETKRYRTGIVPGKTPTRE